MGRLRGMSTGRVRYAKLAFLFTFLCAMVHARFELRRSDLNMTETTQCELNLVCASVLLNVNVEELTATKFQIGQYLPRLGSIAQKLETP